MRWFGRKLSRKVAIRENCYKLQHRWYWTPVRINKIFPEPSDRCWHPGVPQADLIHIWWDYERVVQYWAMPQVKINQIVGGGVWLLSRVSLLNDWAPQRQSKRNPQQKYLVGRWLTAAR